MPGAGGADGDGSAAGAGGAGAAGDHIHPRQPTAPYFDAVLAYGLRGSGRFHVPGHKGGSGADPALRHALGDRALALDVPQDIHGIDLGTSPTPYEQAEALAAEAHGAARTFFLTNGATQGNHALMLALAPLGTRVVCQRNSHASIVDGLVLSGGLPTFVHPEVDDALGMAHGVTPDGLRAALTATPDAAAAFVVSPTYYGMCADIAGLAEVAHAAGVPLVVDQSWGPHFGFHPDVPASALQLDADAVLTSTHKIAGSLTQSAMLHLSASGRVDAEAVARAMRLVRSTSPSSLLMASLDAARRQLAVHGEALLHETLAVVDRTRTKLAATAGLRVLGPELVGRPGIAAWDPLRIVLDVRETGRSGYDVAEALRGAYDGNVELATAATIVLVVGLAESAVALDRVAGDLDETVGRIARHGDARGPVVRPPAAPPSETVVPPREAFLGPAEQVPIADAIGRVSCESIAGYPPGIPALLPGERVTAPVVAYLQAILAGGARLHGASDPQLQTIHVLRT
ncbi:Arginine decarboxylase [Paraconexibacter sp. AEG42_29]|uniref:Arginine decarboxylase n=1 Tax=Paraconexibacter sp. AEG42_29 TaxID=2997339 RepID=A0AAU7AT55_9ACTN